MEAWLDGLSGVAGALAAALRSGGDAPADELAFARGIDCSAEALHARLAKGGALEKLSACLAKQFEQLQQAEAVTADELHDKFVLDDRSFELQLGGLDTFFNGLEGIVGPPKPQVELGMQQDHLEMSDSMEPYDMPNRKVTTTSAIEWRFVAAPLEGADGKGSPFVPYSTQQPLPFEDFAAELAKRNALLVEMRQPKIRREEFFGARLYTGPLYLKYNAVLARAHSSPSRHFSLLTCVVCGRMLRSAGCSSPSRAPPSTGCARATHMRRHCTRSTQRLSSFQS